MTDEIEEVAVAVTYSPEKDRFLLLERASDREIFPGYWDFPSGGIEDETARKAALRELKEETGLNGQVLRTGDSAVVETEYGDFRLHPFLVAVDSTEVELSEEHVDYRWVTPSEIEDMKTVKALEDDLEAVGVTGND